MRIVLWRAGYKKRTEDSQRSGFSLNYEDKRSENRQTVSAVMKSGLRSGINAAGCNQYFTMESLILAQDER
jgi:hypothetical protein